MYFQDITFNLQKFWMDNGCSLMQPFDMEVGAGTLHPLALLRCLDANPWNIVYVQPSRRPADGRYCENPNRLQHYYQLEVILKPSPANVQDLCIESLAHLGLNTTEHDIRFVESDWENPIVGAWGVGYEVWCDGMELVQFTYMQQLGGVECAPVPCEITYGLERLAMYLQKKDKILDLVWDKAGTLYSDVFYAFEKDHCKFNFEYSNAYILRDDLAKHISESERLLTHGLVYPAYEQGLKAAHVFNLLEARGAMGVTDRAASMKKVKNVVAKCCEKWVSICSR